MSSKKEEKTTYNNTQNQTQTRNPWQPANPFIKDALDGVTDLYASDAGKNFFPNQTYVGPSDATKAGLAGIQNKVANNDLTAAAQGNLMDYINGGFEGPADDFYRGAMSGNLNVDTSKYNSLIYGGGGPANAALEGMMSESYSPTNSTSRSLYEPMLNNQPRDTAGRLGNIMNEGYQSRNSRSGELFQPFLNGNESPTRSNLESMMNNGSYSPTQSQSSGSYNKFIKDSNNPANAYYDDIAAGNNPYLDQMAERAGKKTMDLVNSNFAKAGRYGSDRHQDQIAEDVGRSMNEFYGSQYNSDMNRRMAAANARSNDYNQNIAQQMRATDAQSSIEQSDLNRNMQGGFQNRAQQMQAAGMLDNNFYRDQSQRMNAASAISNIEQNDMNRDLQGNLSYRGQQLNAAGQLDNNFNADRNSRMNAANAITNIEQSDLNRNFQGDQASRNRAFNAANSLNSDYYNNRGMSLNALNAQSGIEAGNISNRFNGANSLNSSSRDMDNKQLQAIGMAPQLNAADYQDYNRLLAVGAAQEGYDRQALNDTINRFNYYENNPITREQQFAQLAALYGGMGGTINTNGTSSGNSTSVQKTSGLGSIVGNIGAGVNLAGNLYGMTPNMGSMGGSPGMVAALDQGVINGGVGYQNGQYWS